MTAPRRPTTRGCTSSAGLRAGEGWQAPAPAEGRPAARTGDGGGGPRGIPPTNDLESAIVATLAGNNSGYTAIVRGVNGTTGIAVVELFALP